MYNTSNAIVILAKIAKRSAIDLPVAVYCWARFYFRRRTTESEIQEALARTGFAKLGAVHDSTVLLMLEQIMDELDLERALSKKGQEVGRVCSGGLLDDRLAPLVAQLQPIAEKHLNTTRVKLELTYFQLSRPQDSIDDIPGGAFHVDDNKPNIKFFVYLSDVGPVNGPFKVIPQSHGLTRTKVGRFLQWSLLKNRSALYAGASSLSETTEAIQILGDTGFCFAVDTTAWHMAEPVIDGERRVFVCSFNMA